MALIVLLRGVTVGGHRVFRPSALAKQLQHLGAVNIGAAGTFVFTKPVTRTRLRAELARRLPFAAAAAVCDGREIIRLMSHEFFARSPATRDTVRWVSVLMRRPRKVPKLPRQFPSRGRWLVRVIACDGRFVLGEYRRDARTIRHLGAPDALFDVPGTIRNRNTMLAVAQVLGWHADGDA